MWTITSLIKNGVALAILRVKGGGTYTFDGEDRMGAINKALKFQFKVV